MIASSPSGELVDEWICPDTNPDDLLGNALTEKDNQEAFNYGALEEFGMRFVSPKAHGKGIGYEDPDFDRL